MSIQMKKALRVLLLTLVVSVAVLAIGVVDLQEILKLALAWIQSLGLWAPVIFVLTYICATVLFLPGSLLTLGAGVLFGLVWGSVWVSMGATLGATAAFLVGRYLVRSSVEAHLRGYPHFQAIDQAVANEGWRIVLLTRLSPVFPFNLLNYAFGITRVTLRHYFFASWIGMIPGGVMYVYLGSVAGNLAALGTQAQATTTFEWIFRIIGLIATVLVTLVITRIAKKALTAKIAP